MLRLNELRKNPAAAHLAEDAGARHEIVAERLRDGRVHMKCSCPGQRSEGWCRHMVAVLCARGEFENDEQRYAFEAIVGGTAVEDAANELEDSLTRFAAEYAEMMAALPRTLSSEQLDEFAGAGAGAGRAASELCRAIDRFVREAGRKK